MDLRCISFSQFWHLKADLKQKRLFIYLLILSSGVEGQTLIKTLVLHEIKNISQIIFQSNSTLDLDSQSPQWETKVEILYLYHKFIMYPDRIINKQISKFYLA